MSASAAMSACADEPLLAGLRVLDLSQGISGPYCGAILQQQGAAVVKVEPPAGDWARAMGIGQDGFTAPVLAYNAGKSGLCVDAGTDAGRDALRRIAAQVDIVIQNFRPGVATRLGIGHAALMALNERLIYVSISGFGADGPLADAAATDNVLQAMSGMMHANRSAAGVPQKIGLYLADIAAALYAAQLVGAALYRRALDGRGRHVEVSLLEACAALQSSNILEAAYCTRSGAEPATRAASAPGGIFAVSDGYLTLATLNNAMFARLCAALDLAHWADDARFASNASRLAHADILNTAIATRLRECPLDHWLPRLRAADVLHATVGSYDDLLRDAQVRHAGIFGEVRNAGLPVLPRARAPGCAAAPMPESAPRIGEHSVAVLTGFGFGRPEIEALVATGAVRVAG